MTMSKKILCEERVFSSLVPMRKYPGSEPPENTYLMTKNA